MSVGGIASGPGPSRSSNKNPFVVNGRYLCVTSTPSSWLSSTTKMGTITVKRIPKNWAQFIEEKRTCYKIRFNMKCFHKAFSRRQW